MSNLPPNLNNAIQGVKDNIANAYVAVDYKGGNVPQLANSSNLANAILSITGGGSGGCACCDGCICVNGPCTPVSGISGVPTALFIDPSGLTDMSYVINATVNPPEASNKSIVWTVDNTSAVGAIITGNVISPLDAGQLVLRGTIANGICGSPFVGLFTISVIPFSGVDGYWVQPHRMIMNTP